MRYLCMYLPVTFTSLFNKILTKREFHIQIIKTFKLFYRYFEEPVLNNFDEFYNWNLAVIWKQYRYYYNTVH